MKLLRILFFIFLFRYSFAETVRDPFSFNEIPTKTALQTPVEAIAKNREQPHQYFCHQETQSLIVRDLDGKLREISLNNTEFQKNN